MMNVRKDPVDLTRRDVIKSSAGSVGVGITGIAGTARLNIGIPRVSNVWMDVGSDGDAEFIVEFDGNVERAFHIPGVSEARLENVAANEGLDLTIESVSMDLPENTQSSHMLSGTIANFASVDSDGNRTLASIDLITIDAREIDDLVPIVNVVDRVTPDTTDFFTLHMPDGFTYSLPQDVTQIRDRMSVLGRLISDGDIDDVPEPPVTESQIRYDDTDRKLTVPEITHWLNDDLTWVRSTAILKYSIFHAPGAPYQLMDLYDVDWYGEQSVTDAFEFGAAVGNELGKMAIEKVLLSEAPEPVSAAFDAKSVLSALDPEFMTKYESEGGLLSGVFSGSSGPPDSWGKSGDLPAQSEWLRQALPPDGEEMALDDQGLHSLYVLIEIERGLSQLIATTSDSTALNDIVELYTAVLNQQERIAAATAIEVNRNANNLDDGDYWQNLHEYLITVCSKIEELSEEQRQVINNSI